MRINQLNHCVRVLKKKEPGGFCPGSFDYLSTSVRISHFVGVKVFLPGHAHLWSVSSNLFEYNFNPVIEPCPGDQAIYTCSENIILDL